jgi:rSAM/selenodomain-associated transferase 1
MTSRNSYGIMIKYPEPGRVKTRLARDVGDYRASEICRQVAERVVRNTAPEGLDYQRIIFCDPPERETDFSNWFPGEQLEVQNGSSLGDRMDTIIRYLLSGGAEKAVITGADIPNLSRDIICQAFHELDNADVVIGPAYDGGYYLIGMKSPIPELFRNMPWSTSQVLSETIRALNQSGKSYCLITMLSDLDTAADIVHHEV